MALTETDKNTLEDIVKLDGQCMQSARCKVCPFRSVCLTEFLNPVPPTPAQRTKMAQDVLAHHYLIDQDVEMDEIKKDYKWDKK